MRRSKEIERDSRLEEIDKKRQPTGINSQPEETDERDRHCNQERETRRQALKETAKRKR